MYTITRSSRSSSLLGLSSGSAMMHACIGPLFPVFGPWMLLVKVTQGSWALVKHIYTTLLMWILGHAGDIHYGTKRARGHGRPTGFVARIHQQAARLWFLSDGGRSEYGFVTMPIRTILWRADMQPQQ